MKKINLAFYINFNHKKWLGGLNIILNLANYLAENKALKFVHRRKTDVLDCYAEEKHLMVGKLKYPDLWGRKTRMGFMELYINMRIQQQMSLSRGSS